MKIDAQEITHVSIFPEVFVDIKNDRCSIRKKYDASSNICNFDSVINSPKELHSVTSQPENEKKITQSASSSIFISDDNRQIKSTLCPVLKKNLHSADTSFGFSYEVDSSPGVDSRKFSTDIRIRGKNRKSINHQVTIKSMGDFRAESLLFPEKGIRLSQSPLDATEYERAIARLPPEQLKALRTWTMINGDNDCYSDGTLNLSAQGQKPINYDLNISLIYGLRLYEDEQFVYNHLIAALKNDSIPTQTGSFLRMAEYLHNDTIPWQTMIKPGDIVTNNPAFMSVSSSDSYARDALSWPGSTRKKAIVIYKIENASKPKPLLADSVSTLRHEEEYLYLPESYFRVKGISIAKIASKPMRIGVILSEIDRPENNVVTKNIFSGKIVKKI